MSRAVESQGGHSVLVTRHGGLEALTKPVPDSDAAVSQEWTRAITLSILTEVIIGTSLINLTG